jgi:hypothetical protein
MSSSKSADTASTAAHHLKIFGQRKDKDGNEKYEQPDR